MRGQANRSRAFFTRNIAHFSTIDPISDKLRANTLHRSRKKTRRTNLLPITGLALLGLFGACARSPQGDAEPPLAREPEKKAAASCGDSGHLWARLHGSIAREIDWSSEELVCESMLRPDGKGVRLRFTGSAADSQIAIILALPELRRGGTGPESPTVVTLTVEGSGRFFSTPTLDSCWSDIVSQDPLEDSEDRYNIGGTLYCVTPLGEINGDAAISIPELRFRGIIDWSAK
jgi:hypothetical protein